MERSILKELSLFLETSPSCFHAIDNIKNILFGEQFTQLHEYKKWKLNNGSRYFVTRNDSSIIAFTVPDREMAGMRIIASHSDSPAFKVKENPELETDGQYIRLNVERYGGMLCAPWLDRPLSVAGRVIVETENGPKTRLVNLDRDLCVIPNVAIHFNREINKGYAYNPQVDLLPLFAGAAGEEQEDGAEKAVTLAGLCAQELGIEEEKILASDLFLYNREKGRRMGAKGEFIGSPRLDDLQCAFGVLEGFLQAGQDDVETGCCAVYALFDNEEIGSGTKQGADSTFLSDVLDCVCDALGISGAKKRDILSESFLLSADNAHGVHPNHPEKSDPTNRPYLNGGIVLKFQGSQKYTTDAWSAAQVRSLCKKAGVPCQNFANRADIAGGSTLGNISSAHVSIPAADIGLAQLAMHSAFETAGALDTWYLIALCREYYT